jgi:hypothetical protein
MASSGVGELFSARSNQMQAKVQNRGGSANFKWRQQQQIIYLFYEKFVFKMFLKNTRSQQRI